MSISEQRISTSHTLSHPGAPSSGRIATIESLREHLQWAIELEHFTLPPYLCALYSLDADRNPGCHPGIDQRFCRRDGAHDFSGQSPERRGWAATTRQPEDAARLCVG